MKDLQLNENGDLLVVSGNLIVAESTLQHQHLLLTTSKGEWRENPLAGVGAAAFLKDELSGELLAEIKKDFENDGMIVTNIALDNENIIVNAAYNE
jgi:hypothetical protein